MLVQPSPTGYRQALEGVRFKTTVFGDRTSMSEFRLDQGTVVPAHSHPHEQTGYLVSGRLLFEIDGERFEAVAGTSWCIPSGVEHGAEVVEDTVVVEVFSPPREEYL